MIPRKKRPPRKLIMKNWSYSRPKILQKMAKLNSASQLFLINVLRDMIFVTWFTQPQIWVKCTARSHFFCICCHGRYIAGIYILYYNPILTLLVYFFWKVVSLNYLPFFDFWYFPSYLYQSHYLKTHCVWGYKPVSI